MKIAVELTDKDIKSSALIMLQEMGFTQLKIEDLQVQVRSKQNYNNKEFETGEFKIVVNKCTS